MMKTLNSLLAASVAIMLGCASVNAQLIDDFSGGLSGYTQTTILDVTPGASNATGFSSSTGALDLSTTGYQDIQQIAFIYDGLTLGVGEELKADVVGGTIAGSRNFGLYVGGTAPAYNVREDYITSYGGSNANERIFSRGFDGTSEYDNPGANPTDLAQLFIARTASNTFEAGFYDSTGRIVVTTRTPATANTADFVGFYADIRADGTVGAFDNLMVSAVPEPGTALLSLFAAIGVVAVSRRRERR